MKHSDFLSVRPLGLAAGALGLIASMSRSASADEYFIDNATIDHTVLYNAFVGWDGGSVYASPTVGVTSDAVIWGGLHTYKSSVVNFQGGEVRSDARLWDTSRLSLQSGSIDYGVWAHDGSNLSMVGGYIGNYLMLYDTSSADIRGGGMANMQAIDHATITMHNCSVFGNIYASGQSTIDVASLRGRVEYDDDVRGPSRRLGGFRQRDVQPPRRELQRRNSRRVWDAEHLRNRNRSLARGPRPELLRLDLQVLRA